MDMPFSPHHEMRQIIIVGLGGTGSETARLIARMIYDLKARRIRAPQLTLIDPDTVETSNIGRQNFAPNHAGLNKAQCLAAQFSANLGLEVLAYDQPFNARHHLNRHSHYDTLLISCVDNAAARREINALEKLTVIDSGNEHAHGQLCMGNTHNMAHLHDLLTGIKSETAYLPHPYLLFPELLQDDPPDDPEAGLSCDERLLLGSQHLLINNQMAQLVARYVYALLYRKPIIHFISFTSLEHLTTRSIAINPDNLRAYLDMGRRKADAL